MDKLDKRENRKSIPIYLAGVSMGATSVLMASELELPDNVFGIAADSAFTSLHAIWKHVSESNLHIPYALHKTGADRMCKKRIKWMLMLPQLQKR